MKDFALPIVGLIFLGLAVWTFTLIDWQNLSPSLKINTSEIAEAEQEIRYITHKAPLLNATDPEIVTINHRAEQRPYPLPQTNTTTIPPLKTYAVCPLGIRDQMPGVPGCQSKHSLCDTCSKNKTSTTIPLTTTTTSTTTTSTTSTTSTTTTVILACEFPWRCRG